MYRFLFTSLLIGLAVSGRHCLAGERDPLGDEGVVASEEPVTETAAVVENADEGQPGVWSARAIQPRMIDGKPVYIRHSSDAFADPDDRMSLEAKYYFVLGDAAAVTRRANRDEPKFDSAKVTIAPKDSKLTERKDWLTHALSNDRKQACVEWLDHNSPKPKLLIVLAPSEPSKSTNDPDRELAVIRGKQDGDRLLLEKLIAARTIEHGELVEPEEGASALATWDLPTSWAGKAMFLNRLVALLKKVGGRYCVDFYGTNLQADGDCRLWLTPENDSLGKPVGIGFAEIPVRKENGSIGPVAVLVVSMVNEKGERTEIGLDFPLCRPAIMEQMQKAMADNKPKQGENQQGPDLVKLVGEDLLEEFARRLVNGTYR